MKLRQQIKEQEKELRRHVSRQGFYRYLANKDRPWTYQPLANAMMEILAEDNCNDTYGRIRMYQALMLKQPENVGILSGRTVYRVMEDIGISHHPGRRPNRITKADREADTNMKALLCAQALKNAAEAYPDIRGATDLFP